MNAHQKNLLVAGIILVLGVFLYWDNQANHKVTSVISVEPTYEGHPVSYWTDHLVFWGGQWNAEAEAAIKAMGPKAAPYFGQRMAQRMMIDAGTPNFNYYEPLLKAFELLGPDGKPAVPYLIKSLGLNFDCSERALVSIGSNAVPELADKLLATLSDTKNPFYHGAIRMNIHKDSGFFIRGRILSVFDQMGTNAEAALPALIFTASTNLPIFREDFSRQNHYKTLAIVGQNHPDAVIPVLLKKFTSSAPERGQIAEAMAVFGTNQANACLPTLVMALSDKKTDDSGRIQIGQTISMMAGSSPDDLVSVFLAAMKDQSSPEPVRCFMAGYLAKVGSDKPDIVVSALMVAYTNSSLVGRSSIAGALAQFPKQSRSMVPLMLSDAQRPSEHPWDNHWRINLTLAMKAIAPDVPGTLSLLLKDLDDPQAGIRQQTIYALGNLGTNGYEAVPVLLKCLSHPDTQTRIDATRELNQIGVTSDEFISALGMNLSCSNEFMVQEAEETLVTLAGHSELAYVTIAKSGKATFLLGMAMRTNTPALLKGLESNDPRVRLGTLEVFNEFRYPMARPHLVPEAIPKLRELSTNDPDQKVRERAADMLYWQAQ